MGATKRLMTQKRTMGFKIESDPYVAETLAAADYYFSIYGIEYTPEMESYARKLARGHYSRDVSISGKRKFKCTCSVDVHKGSAAATPPQYYQLLRACGLKQVTYGSTGVALITDSTYDRVPATIEIAERQEGTSPSQIVFKGRGCMGEASIVFDDVGVPAKITFEFQGAWESVTTRAFGSYIAPTGFDTALPPALLGATILLAGTVQYISKMTLALGNQVSVFKDPSKASGYCGARIVDRNPTLEIDPDMVISDDVDWFTNVANNSTGQFTITIGENFHIEAPVAQVVQPYAPADDDGHVKNNLKLELKGNVGDDELVIRQGDVS